MRICLIGLLLLVVSCGDKSAGPLQELRVELDRDYYDRGTAFLPVDGDVENVEVELEGERLPFTVGAARLASGHEALNRARLAFGADPATLTTPVMPTYELADGGVFFIDPTYELSDEIIVVGYR
jgi:hypothetical protein